MMILCENTDCLNHGPSGCKLPAIRIDCDGGCYSCRYPDDYWEQCEKQIIGMVKEKKE